MISAALTCPQCAAPLPAQAQWRLVTCAYCRATVTRSTNLVQRARFRERYLQAQAQAQAAAQSALSDGRSVAVGGQRYRILRQFASGIQADVFLAQRISPLPERVTLKLARAATNTLAAEAAVLHQLQQISSQGASFFTQLLPQAIACGTADLAGLADSANLANFAGPLPAQTNALVLRHPPGFWGSLAQVLHYQPHGIDPRHAVWIWRRMLDVLAFVHQAGWVHGDVCLAHLLVHPADHGIMIIGWSRAQHLPDSRFDAPRHGRGMSFWRDLMQAACCIRMLLAGSLDSDANLALAMPTLPPSVPDALARLLCQASEDPAWCAKTGASGINEQLVAAALAAFGPPRFLKFKPGLF